MTEKIYKKPKYYEIAFGFIDPEKQVNLFEDFISKYSKIEVDRVLDIGCGTSLQLREMAWRDYECLGLDRSQEMLDYLKHRVEEENITCETVNADMVDFKLEKKVDFAFIMMGTINLMKSNEDFLNHLNSVTESLRSGGLYLIENVGALEWLSEDLFGEDSWTESEGKINIKTTYSVELKDKLKQEVRETIKMEIEDGGNEGEFTEVMDRKLIFPQELLTLIKLNGEFEFLGWFERDRMKKLDEANKNNIVLLRRK
ncbi:MAG: class I SAM-dependent methyltransferase [Candidatus Aenigmatarchaeota archaeon]